MMHGPINSEEKWNLKHSDNLKMLKHDSLLSIWSRQNINVINFQKTIESLAFLQENLTQNEGGNQGVGVDTASMFTLIPHLADI